MTLNVFTCFIICIFSIFIYSASPRSHKHKDGDGNSRSCSKCGTSHPSHKGKVINGVVVEPINKYPWMVALKNSAEESYCGGAILNEWYILTAAHCLTDREPEDIRIAFLTEEDSKVTDGSPVEELIPHPGYIYGAAHDIGLIKLQEPIVCNEFAAPICLPPPDLELEPEWLSAYRIAGWGQTNDLEHATDLLEGRIQIVPMDECTEFQDVLKFESTSYCCKASDDTGPCFGDSGGSMFKRYGSKFFSLGVTSTHSSFSCDLNAPFVYVSVSKHMDWIQYETGIESKKISPNHLPPHNSKNGRKKVKSKERFMWRFL